jgi:hypothetical protein
MGTSFIKLIYVAAASLCAISPVSAADFGNVKGSQGQPSFNPSTYPGTGRTTGGAGANTNAGTGAPIGSATLSVGTATDSGPTRSGGSQSTSTVAAPGGQSIANADITGSTPPASPDAPSADCYARQQLAPTAQRPPGVQGRLSPRGCGNGGNTSSGGDLVEATVFEVY